MRKVVAVWGADGVLQGTGLPGDDDADVDPRSVFADASRHVANALSGRSFEVPLDTLGRSGVCAFSPLRDAGGKITGVVAVAIDAPSSEHATDELRERLAFEELITELSTRFVTLGADNIDGALNDALAAIGEFSGVDRAYIFRFTPDRRAMDNTHEWCAEGISPQMDTLQGLPLESLPWWTAQLKARRVIHVPDVNELPPEASEEKVVLRAQDIKSVLAIPMVCDDTVVGMVGFDAVRGWKNWPKKDIALLRIAGEIFVSAIERARADEERRRLEAQLVQARSLESVARLAGGVAHDFNNLLAVVLNYATLLKREITDESQREKIGDLFDAARRAADLTRQLLLVGRRDVVEPVLLDLSTVVTALRLELAADLDLVRVGLPQLEQVIVNLTLNARDATPSGGSVLVRTENVDVSVELAKGHLDLHPGRYVRLRVADDGEGMTPEVASRAFEPFFTTKGMSGTGLGLATVHGIVKQSGGLVTITTEQGVGTTVDVLFPVFARSGTADAAEMTPAPASAPFGLGETVLVVDDSAGVRKLVCAMLADNRYRPIEAATPEAALALCEQHAGSIDLVLTDVVMPQMSGRDLALRLRREFGITCVLYMSGYENDVIAHHGVLEEDVHLLQKPFLEAQLLRAVRAVLDAGRCAERSVSA
jgi:signal transduction histidine kinase